MDAQTLYGILFLCYVIPYFVWMIAREQRLEILKQFYPGRADEKALERREFTIAALWFIGLLLLLAGWNLHWHLVPTILLVSVTWIAGFFVSRAFKARKFLQTKRARAIVAASGVWCSLVAGWYVIFGDRYGFDPGEAVLLALVPILIGLFAYGAFLWVKKAQQ